MFGRVRSWLGVSSAVAAAEGACSFPYDDGSHAISRTPEEAKAHRKAVANRKRQKAARKRNRRK